MASSKKKISLSYEKGTTDTQKSMKQIKKELTDCENKIRAMDAECEEDENVQDDTDWTNEYYGLQGWVEALTYAVEILEKEASKPKK